MCRYTLARKHVLPHHFNESKKTTKEANNNKIKDNKNSNLYQIFQNEIIYFYMQYHNIEGRNRHYLSYLLASDNICQELQD
jgi:hypothetical protein